MDKYFADDESKRAVEHLLSKSQEWFRNIQHNRYLDKIKRSWASYHGVYYEDSHAITFGGEQGELVNLAINHYRNLAQHMLVMVTSSRPSFQARAVNMDRKSSVQAKLANGLLDYYMREKRLERYLKTAVEYSIAMASGYVKMEWNATKGEIYDYIEPDENSIVDYDEDGKPLDKNGDIIESYPIYEGDVEFSTLSPLDVVFDSTKESSEDHEWVLCRSFINKYNLMKKFPELAEQIKIIDPKDSKDGKRLSLTPYDETTDIPVYEFFHKRTEALPNGRYIMYLDSEVILMDTIMPYRDLPIYRIAPSNILGTPYGYTPMFDLLPIQDKINSLYSTIATNQNAFGVQNIINPRGNDVKVNQLEGGLNFIEYNHQVGAPQPLNLTNTPAEIFNFVQMLERSMETISGINSVARGNPESSLKSGNALALVQSQALQFISGLQQSYIQLLEDVATGLINILKDFAKAPRVAAISGLNNISKMKEFTGDDIENINRVVVDVGNALMQTTAGRAEVAQNLLQMGIITNPEQYLMVLNTGNLDPLINSQYKEMDTIMAENEYLLTGKEVKAIITDNHAKHIREHKSVIADPDLRNDPELVARTIAHIQEHIDLARTVDPELLTIIGEQPLSPQGGTPNNPQNFQNQVPAGAPGSAELQANPDVQQLSVADQLQNLPSQPRAAGEDILGPQPNTPQELMMKNSGGQ